MASKISPKTGAPMPPPEVGKKNIVPKKGLISSGGKYLYIPMKAFQQRKRFNKTWLTKWARKGVVSQKRLPMIPGENQWKNLRHWRGILLRGHGWLQNPILSYLSYPLQFRMKKSKDSCLGRCYHLRFCMNFSWRYADEKVNIGQHVWKHPKSPISGIFQLCYQKSYMSSRWPFVKNQPHWGPNLCFPNFSPKKHNSSGKLKWSMSKMSIFLKMQTFLNKKSGGDDPMFHSKKKQNTGFLPRRKRENLQATRPFDPSGNGICHAEPGSRSNTVIQKT